jgi:hypothetical protein
MTEIDTERARAAAEDLVDLLSAYDSELTLLAAGLPGITRLRQAIGAALAEASDWISDRDAAPRRTPRTTH